MDGINKLNYFDKVLLDLPLIYSVTLDLTKPESLLKTSYGSKR